jgi:hypothetical protein
MTSLEKPTPVVTTPPPVVSGQPFPPLFQRKELGIYGATLNAGLAAITKPTLSLPIFLFMLRHNPKYRDKFAPHVAKLTKNEMPGYRLLFRAMLPFMRRNHLQIFMTWSFRIGVWNATKEEMYPMTMVDRYDRLVRFVHIVLEITLVLQTPLGL